MKRRSTLVSGLLLVVGLGLLFPGAKAVASRKCDHKIKADVMPLLDSGIAGEATLCINDTGVRGSMVVEHLQPGDAYTVWFIYVDRPDLCVGGLNPPVCVDPDSNKPLVVFGRFDSAVGPTDGEEEFEGRVRGLLLSRSSQVWLLMFGHGPADTNDHSHLARQLLTPEDPGAGVPHLGNVVDGPRFTPAAIAVFDIR